MDVELTALGDPLAQSFKRWEVMSTGIDCIEIPVNNHNYFANKENQEWAAKTSNNRLKGNFLIDLNITKFALADPGLRNTENLIPKAQ